jgi:hypothetical protein
MLIIAGVLTTLHDSDYVNAARCRDGYGVEIAFTGCV